MLLGSHDITFCPNKECTREECRRHYIHTWDIPKHDFYSMFTDDPSKGDEENCPYYWKWYPTKNEK